MMPVMALFWIAVIGGVVWLIVYLARRSEPGQGRATTETALDILSKRYARGEISKEEFDRMKRDLIDS